MGRTIQHNTISTRLSMRYEIARNSRRCSVTDREIGPGEVYYSALVDTVTGPIRVDFSMESWTGPPENALGYWRGRIPEETAPSKPKPITAEQMFAVFEELSQTEEPEQLHVRYVLSLLLMRRKALKLQDVERQGDHEVLVLSRSKSSQTFRVSDPKLSDEQIQQVEERLDELLATYEQAGEQE